VEVQHVIRFFRLGVLTAPAVALAIGWMPPHACALDLLVNETEDAVDAVSDGTCADAEGRCTLRAAVQEANGSVGPDSLTLPAGVYTLKRVGAGEDLAASGDLDVTGTMTLGGAGVAATVIQGKKDRVFHIAPGAQVEIRDLTITKGKVGGKGVTGNDASGGGVRNDGELLLERVVVTKNKAGDDAGGITNQGVLVLVDVTLSSNKAKDDAGGFDNDAGTVTLRGVTLSKNKAKDEAGGFESEEAGTVDGENVTVTGNKAREAGGVNVEQGGTLSLLNMTVTGNKAKEGGGGVNNEDGSTLELSSSVIAGNKKQNCGGTITSLGGNVEAGTSCGFAGPADQGGVADAGLEQLADNGGPTATHALAPGSPAIDFGDDAQCPLLDQRGLGRFDDPAVAGSICDSGAFERQAP
jgi:hypothetical protein